MAPSPRMDRIVGMDLGTTNSLVAVVDGGLPLVLADRGGRRLTPSVVHFPPGDVPPVVGQEANRLRVLEPARTVYSAKRFMGRRAAEVPAGDRSVTYAVGGAGGGPVEFQLPDRPVTPEQVAAAVLARLKEVAETALGESVRRAVITVPAYFNDAQRNATKRAGELAGLTVERVLNEPTAAALAYGLDRLRERARVAVYDLGGGTFDLSILELREGVFQVLATHGDTRLGGDDLDRRLLDHLAGEIVAAGGPDLRLAGGERRTSSLSAELVAAQSRLREAVESAKIRLSSESEVEVVLPFLTPGFSFSRRVDRATLERLTRDLVERTRSHCLRALADARIEARELDQVILVGGQTRMPLVRRVVAEWFGCRNGGEFDASGSAPAQAGPELNVSVNPDEAVALGAAIQAEVLAGGFRDVLLLDVTPLSLGIETFGGLMNVIIPRNSTIPVKAGEMFTTAVDNQRSMLIHLLQGERERARDNWSLGRFDLEFEPAPRGVPRVGVQFEIDADGILRVLARDVKTGCEKVVQVRSVVDVEDAAVQRMVEESLDHAGEDLAARRWVEARLRAEQTILATRKALGSAEAPLAGEEAGRIGAAVAEVEAALATEEAGSGAGDLARLKTALASLDEATRPLAERLMDQAMEAMLRQRGLIG